MSVFGFKDYRHFLKDFVAKSPKKGRGKLRELANHLRIHPTVVSQVFSGLRDFTEEQALDIGDYLQLTPIEQKYFRLLVRHATASTPRLRQSLAAEINELKQSAKDVSKRVNVERALTDTERSIFYSSWFYPACRLFCSTNDAGKSADEVGERFGLSRVQALEILEFLAATGLCVRDGDNFKMGPQSTFVEKSSPFFWRQHSIWRIKSIQASESRSEDDLLFTGMMSLSRADFQILRERMAEFLKEVSITVKDSKAEDIACLNMDFFWIRK